MSSVQGTENQTQVSIELLTSALEHASVRYMIGDANFDIVYLNRTAQNMFEMTEYDIRKDLPHFRANNLLGQSIDIFHKNPGRIRSLLMQLTSTHQTTLKLGGRLFRLSVTPIDDQSGTRLGYSVEWNDVTDSEKQRHEVEAAEQAVQDMLEKVSRGDLSHRLPTHEFSGFAQVLAGGLNELLAVFGDALQDIVSTAHRLSTVVSQFSAASESVAAVAAQQSAAVEESSAALEEITKMVESNSTGAKAAHKSTNTTRDSMVGAQERMTSLLDAMGQIRDSSTQIAKIMKLIDDMSFQTNLLAVNAAVEAARAGKYGKGFGVVAHEVRRLSHRSAQAAKDTSELLDVSAERVQEGSQIAEETASKLTDILKDVGEVTEGVSEIASRGEEQARAVSEVTTGIHEVQRGAQDLQRQSVQLAQGARELRDETQGLVSTVSFFTLNDRGRPVAREERPRQLSAPSPAYDRGRSSSSETPSLEVDRDERGFDKF